MSPAQTASPRPRSRSLSDRPLSCILRGIRVIDPLAQRDTPGQDVRFVEGRITAISDHLEAGRLRVVDLTPPAGDAPLVLCPGFIDIHAHLREPSDEEAETVASGSRAAAAGGFVSVLAMANTTPPIDSPERVAEAQARAAASSIRVLTGCALTRGLGGGQLVPLEDCAHAGAVAFSDDGRNAASQDLLREAITRAAPLNRPIIIHAEDEELLARVNPATGPVHRFSLRPVAAETTAIASALRALADAGRGHLHIQHISSADAVEMIRRAKEGGASVTAEVTPHHLGLSLPPAVTPDPPALLKVNPPLRTERDRQALVEALRCGILDTVATDHAPHRMERKALPYDEAPAGIMGLELALSTCITLGGMGGEWLPTLIERLTAGPFRVLGPASGAPAPRIRIGEPASCVLLDPSLEWTVDATRLRSHSRNNPLIGSKLRGMVLLTLADGRIVHCDQQRLRWNDTRDDPARHE